MQQGCTRVDVDYRFKCTRYFDHYCNHPLVFIDIQLVINDNKLITKQKALRSTQHLRVAAPATKIKTKSKSCCTYPIFQVGFYQCKMAKFTFKLTFDMFGRLAKSTGLQVYKVSKGHVGLIILTAELGPCCVCAYVRLYCTLNML